MNRPPSGRTFVPRKTTTRPRRIPAELRRPFEIHLDQLVECGPQGPGVAKKLSRSKSEIANGKHVEFLDLLHLC